MAPKGRTLHTVLSANSKMSDRAAKVATTDLALTKCQRQAMAAANAEAERRGAFSTCTKISPKGYLEVLTYWRQPSSEKVPEHNQLERGSQEARKKENATKQSPGAALGDECSVRRAPPAPSSDAPPLRDWQVVPSKSKPQPTKKVNKNVLSARGDGGKRRLEPNAKQPAGKLQHAAKAGAAQPKAHPSSSSFASSDDEEFSDAMSDDYSPPDVGVKPPVRTFTQPSHRGPAHLRGVGLAIGSQVISSSRACRVR